jgi:hypothetical protein
VFVVVVVVVVVVVYFVIDSVRKLLDTPLYTRVVGGGDLGDQWFKTPSRKVRFLFSRIRPYGLLRYKFSLYSNEYF